MQALLFRAKHEDDLYKPAAFVNFAAAGVIGAIAVSNFRVPKPTVAPGYLTPP